MKQEKREKKERMIEMEIIKAIINWIWRWRMLGRITDGLVIILLLILIGKYASAAFIPMAFILLVLFAIKP